MIGIEERYKREITRTLSETVTAVNGIEPILESLSIPCCVASSGSHEKMRATLGKTGLLKYFHNALFSISEVKRGKPFPDVYLYAAGMMGVSDPGKCLMIEDSALGVRGGVAAGMTVFGYAEHTYQQQLLDAGAHGILQRMGDLPGMMEDRAPQVFRRPRP